MATVDVLVTGHVEHTDAGESVHPTISLVRDGDLVIVVDPGILSDPSLLTDALRTHGLTPADVNSELSAATFFCAPCAFCGRPVFAVL